MISLVNNLSTALRFVASSTLSIGKDYW